MLRNRMFSAVMSAVMDSPTTGGVVAPAPAPVPVPETPEQAAVRIAAENAAKAAKMAAIQAKFNNLVDMKESKFFFKKVDIEADDPANPGKKMKVGEKKRPTIEIPLPVPSVEGIVEILKNGLGEDGKNTKSLDLLLEAVGDVIAGRARDIINDNEKITGMDDFPMDELSWEAIANLPKAERRGGGISKEIWEAFAEDYIAVMPAVTGKTAEQVGNAAKILLNKFNQVKTVKQVLKLMKEQIRLYVANSPNAETYSEAVTFLLEKVETLINFDESKLLQNL